MYRVLKTSGYSSQVVVENTDTKANVIVGKINSTITKILDDYGYTDIPSTSEEWNFEVNKEAATTLSRLALGMNKPIRKKIIKEEPKKVGQEVDAFDLIFGNV